MAIGQRRKGWKKALLVGLATTIAALLLTLSELFAAWEWRTQDALGHLRASTAPDDPVVVIGVDDATLAKYGWPIERNQYGYLLYLLRQAGVSTVVFDILFVDPDAHDPTQDTQFGRFITESGGTTLAVELRATAREHEGGRLPGTDAVLARAWPGQAGPALPRANDVLAPVAPLRTADTDFGHLNLWSGPAGIVRAVFPFYRVGDALVPALALTAARQHLGVAPGAVATTGDQVRLTLGARELLLDSTQLIDFRRGAGEIPTHSMIEVLQVLSDDAAGNPDAQRLRAALAGKLVLVGSTARSLGDFGPSPLAASEPLVYVHANAISMLLAGTMPHRAPGWVRILLALLVGILVALGTAWLRTAQALLAAVALLAVTIGLATALILNGTVLDVLRPTFVLVLTYTATAVFQHFTRDRQERLVRDAFRKYVAPRILDRIIDDPGCLDMGGRRRKLTILFSDIKGYTALSNKLDAHEILDLLREYLDAMQAIILREEGTVDKIMGDGIMAFFGDPIRCPDPEVRAVRTGVEMQQEVTRLRRKWEAEGKTGLAIRVGVATGEVYVGNVGSTDHLDYTAIGPAVNLASRLESKGVAGGVQICRETFAALEGQFTCTEHDEPIELKGFGEYRPYRVEVPEV